MMRAAGDDPDGLRLRGLIVVLWRAGLRISEALALVETDLDQTRGAILVRRGKGGKRREVGMDRWAWEQLVHGSRTARRCRSARCSAFCEARHADDHAHRRACERSSATLPRLPECGAASRPINSGTHTPSRCPAKEFRSWSSNASSGMPTWRSPRRTYAGSTTQKSSKPSTNDRRR